MRKIVTLTIFIFIGFHFLAGQTCAEPSGLWQNEAGSVLVIDSISQSGRIIGSYKSSTGVDGKTFDLLGWVNHSDSLPKEWNYSFSVRWVGYGSITSWSGYCDENNGDPQIKTLWHLVRSGQSFSWERIITNSSLFKPIMEN